MMTNTTKLYNEIMQGQRPQDRVDSWANLTNKALDIYQQEGWQARVDKWVEQAKN